MTRLLSKHPNYEVTISEFIAEDSLKPVRETALSMLRQHGILL